MMNIDVGRLGERIARYRKLDGLSAQELADRAGAGLTRAIVANIESGRRVDISLSHLLSIAWALRVPPVALIYPLEAPDTSVEVEGDERSARELIEWFQGWSQRNPFDIGETTNAGLETSVLLRGLERLRRIENERDALLDQRAADPDSSDGLDLGHRIVAIEDDIAHERSMLGLLGIRWGSNG